MADNLIFRVGFDLETAVKNAEREGLAAIERLDKIFSRQPLALRMDKSGFEKYSSELSQNIDQLKTRLKDLVKEFDAIPLGQKWEENNGVKTLTTDAKKLWDELLRITEILKSVGQGAQQMANQSIREIDKEIAALEKLKQKEIEARQTKQNKQLQSEWNAAADQHKRDLLAEEKRLQEENNRIRKEAEAIAQREAEIEKLVVEYKLRQTQAQQAKKKASDEDYANLVKQLREEERLSAEKARQEALDMRKERQAEATAAIERERAARRQLFETKRQQMLEEQRIISSQSMSYDALIAKLQVWQNIQNRSEVGSKKWEAATVAIRQTKEMLALVTDEMTKSERAAERMRKLREVLSANEKTLTGLNAKLAEYNSRIQGLEAGSAKFNKTALEIRRLTEELQKATQQMQDFQQKSFQGLSDSLTKGKVQALTQLREQLRLIEADFNRLNQTGASYNPNGGLTTAANDILRQREALIKQINQMLSTAADAQMQREKEINRVIEQRRAKADAIAAKRKSEQAAIQANINKLKEERRILNQQESSVAAITAKLQIQQQRLQSAKFGSDAFNKAAKEVERLSKKLDEAKQKIDNLTGRTQSAASAQSAAVRQVNQEFQNQDGYVSRLLKRMAVYAGYSAIGSFLTNVREVTAEFELQRISLGAIIQDQARANQLFEEIKTFALKSPVKILDLTKYTKQLAAYKIGVDELFDTTKRLTDISVGLGVSMDRIVLMYGQIRATGYLRASEVRQATEAGIPLVEELANKLSKANGELVTAADVMDMISKRAISFDMVKEVFDDMTSAGGIFYNMQEKQGNTLYGMWQKLGDAAAVMYDQIGNTESVNNGMKMAIQTLRYLMLHWKQVGVVISGATVYLVANMVATKNAAIATAAATSANQIHVASLQQKLAALRLEQMNLKSTHIFQRLYTAATISATKAQIGAATSTNVFSKALYGLKAALLSNPLTALAVALTTIIALLMQSESELDKLNSKIQDIDRDYDASGKKSVDRFKELVKAVEENVDGSKAQKEALDELDRTYSKILGSEALELDSLKALGGKYGELIDLIDAYNAKKRGEEKETAIRSSYATILDEEKDDLMDYLNQAGMSAEKQAAFIQTINDKILEGKDAVTATNEAFNEFANDISQLDAAGNIINVLNFDKLADAWGVGFRQLGGLLGGQGMDYLYNYARALEGQNDALEENEKKTKEAADALGVYSTSVDNLNKSLKNLDWSSQEALFNSLQDYNAQHPENMISVPIDLSFDPAKAESEYDKLLETSNLKINAIFSVLQQIARQEGQTIPDEFYKQAQSVVDGNKDFSFIDWNKLEEQFKNSPKALAALRASKQLYESIAPSDETIRVFNRKFMTLADNMDVSLDKMQKYLMKSGDNLGEHRKKLSDEVTKLLKDIARLEWTKKMLSAVGLPADVAEAKINEAKQTLELLQSMIAEIPDIEGIGKKNKGGRKSDPRLQTLQEIANKMAEVNKEYDELLKKEGQTKALADTQKLFASSFEQMKATAKKYGFKLPAFEVPQTIEDVQKWYKAVSDEIKRLDLKNADKVLIELGFKSDKAAIDKQQKDIEKQLKQLADRISRTKTAKEFYEKILSQTGDVELAARVSLSIYGSTGEELFEDTVAQIREVFKSGKEDVVIDLEPIFDMTNQRIDYKMLADIYEKYQNDIIEKNRDTAQKIAQEGQKTTASNIANWQKELAKAKDFEQQRTDIIRTAAAEREKIIKEVRDPEERERLLNLSREKESQDLSKLNFEEFTKSEDYIKIFENLDNTATSTLKRLRTELQTLIDTNKDLSPENMKTLVKAMEDIDEEIGERNPWESMVSSVKNYMAAIKSARIARDELAKAEAGYAAQEPQLKANIETAKGEKATADADVEAAEQALLAIQTQMAELRAQEIVDETALMALKQQEIVAENNLVAAKTKQNQAEANVKGAVQKQAAAYKKVTNAQKKVNNTQNDAKKSQNDFLTGINNTKAAVEKVQGAMESLEPILGDLVAEGSVFGDAWNAVLNAMSTFTAIMEVVIVLQETFNIVSESNPWMAIAAAVLAVTAALAGFIGAQKVKKANKEIERQQELLDQLEYTYGRLQKAADKLFGTEYLQNYNQQLKVLEAQHAAYLKQAEAERSKGKKADEEKIKEYENHARDTADAIKEMQDDLVAHFTGSSRTDVARQMAQSWIDARVSMSDTFAAIKGDYSDMIKNMIVEGAAARVIENALTPMWDNMEKMLADNDINGAIDSLVNGMDAALTQANNGMEVLWKSLEARGYDMKQLIGDVDSEYTGIAKNVAGATSEEINAVAAIGNTLMYYESHLPVISQNVAAIYELMSQGRGSALPDSGSTGWTDWQQQAMDNYNAIARNTADTVVECRRAAVACEAATEKLNRALRTKGATSGFNVWLNS